MTTTWSNKDSEAAFMSHYPDEPELREKSENGEQCGGCSFFAKFNGDWGLCCHAASRHHLETVFEHFTCPDYVHEGWGPHSFSDNDDFRCRCGGGPWFEDRKES